jgi:uncharacterized protein (TIGR00159 family)
MELLGTILGQFMGVGVLAAVILFQQEIRKFLMLVGNTTNLENNKLINVFRVSKEVDYVDVNVVVKAAQEMSKDYSGALIVFERSSNLEQFVETGDAIDAVLSKRLLLTIFNKHTPLHDGAVIIRNGRVDAARCIIPVSDNQFLPAHYGLRHRAAVGITEHTDAIVVVVSEESGKMSFIHDGKVEEAIDPVLLRSELNKYLHEEQGG